MSPLANIRTRQPNEPLIIPNGPATIMNEGRIGAIVHFPVLVDEGAGYIERTFEKFVRAPGTRIIAVRDTKIYLQQEMRLERGNTFDWRLPGGKVLDSFQEYKEYLGKDIPESLVLAAAARELQEEAGLKAQELTIFTKKECGTTVEWDLYYVVAKEIQEITRGDHAEGEDIKTNGWFTFDEVLTKCKLGEISEGRTVAALLEFMTKST